MQKLVVQVVVELSVVVQDEVLVQQLNEMLQEQEQAAALVPVLV
jgi:hypothetical protein